MFVFVMGFVGLYFTIKSVKTAKGTAEKSFCGIGSIENDFERAGALRKNRCVVYISISLDNVKRLYSESKAVRIYEQIKRILFKYMCLDAGGDISIYGNENFVALNNMESGEIEKYINKCYEEINEIFVKQGVVGVVRVKFGYHITSSTEVSFKTALTRAKQACSMAEDQNTLYCQWDSSNG